MHLLPEIVAVVTGLVIATGWANRPRPEPIPVPVRGPGEKPRRSN